MTLSRPAVAVAFAAVTAGYAVAGAAMLDLRVRQRVETETALNAWGYQGPARFRKDADEHRVVVVGGSAAVGFGVRPDLALPSVLEVRLNQPRRLRRPKGLTSVAQLAEPGAGAATYVSMLEDFAYLHADVVCLYDGYAAVDAVPAGGGRRGSWIFRHIGYRPVLFDEAAVRAAVAADPPMAAFLRDGADVDASCAGLSAAYCAAMADAVQWGLDHGKAVMVVTPPFVSRRHEAQQRSLAAALRTRFGADPRFSSVDLGMEVDLQDSAVSRDREHLTVAGIERVAESLVDPIYDAIVSLSVKSR